MARVSVEQIAFTDERFVRLGTLIGGDRWAAIGRMTLVWNTCQEREQHTLPFDVVNAIHPDIKTFADLLAQCQLGRKTKRGLYIAGARERCGWLKDQRRKGKKYGPLGAEYGKLGGRPRKPAKGVSDNPPKGIPENPPLTLALTLTKESKTKARATRVPEPFVVDEEMRQWASTHVPTLDLEAATENFVDVWRGRAGSEGVKLDWRATWRTGMHSRNERGQFQRKTSRQPRPQENSPEVLALMNEASKGQY